MTPVKAEIQEVAKSQAELVVNDAFVTQMADVLKKKTDAGFSLPPDYNVTNALTNAYLVLRQTVDRNKAPVLQTCSQASIANALLDMATAGLDASKAQGYFIPYGGKLTFQKSYFGWQTLARRVGAVKFTAQCIYTGDEFSYDVVDGEIQNICHKQSFGNIDKDKIAGVYGVVTMLDGSKVIDIMTIDEIKQAWRQNKQNGGNGDTHKNFTKKMAKKTVLSSICKQLANTYGNASVIEQIGAEIENEDVDLVATNATKDILANENTIPFELDPDLLDDEGVFDEVEIEEVGEEDLPDFLK